VRRDGATLSLCWLTPQWMYFSHVGDSRIYYAPHDGPLVQVTHDHTMLAGFDARASSTNGKLAPIHAETRSSRPWAPGISLSILTLAP
jgi:protein phosphatase